MEPAFSAVLSCNLVHVNADQRGERDFQNRLTQTGAKGLSATRKSEAEANTNAWIGQIKAQSQQMSESRQTIQSVQQELALKKQLTPLQKLESQTKINSELLKKLNRAVDQQKAQGFHDLSPHIFDPDFKPHLEESWKTLSEGNAVLDHLDEVWNFLAASESHMKSSSTPNGSHLLSLSQSRLQDILRIKLKSASAEKRQEFEELTIAYLHRKPYNEDYQSQILQRVSMLEYSSETLIFELMELRLSYFLGHILARNEGDDGFALLQNYKSTIHFVARHLTTASVGFQQYVLNERHHKFKNWHSLLLYPNVELIEPVREALKKKLLQNENLWGSLDIAEYFIQYRLYKEEVTEFLQEASQSADLNSHQKTKVLTLQVAAKAQYR